MYAGQTYYGGLSTGALGTSTVTLASAGPGSSQVAQAHGTATGDPLVDMKTNAHPLPDPWVFAGSSSVGFLLEALEM